MMLINNKEVEQVLTMEDTIAALKHPICSSPPQEAVCRPRIDIRIPASDPARNYQWAPWRATPPAGVALKPFRARDRAR